MDDALDFFLSTSLSAYVRPLARCVTSLTVEKAPVPSTRPTPNAFIFISLPDDSWPSGPGSRSVSWSTLGSAAQSAHHSAENRCAQHAIVPGNPAGFEPRIPRVPYCAVCVLPPNM